MSPSAKPTQHLPASKPASGDTLPYNIGRWGKDYLSVNPAGELEVSLPGKPAASFEQIAQALQQEGLRLPVLLRFKAILHDKVNALVDCFNQAISQHDYPASYQVVYPIKVNQQRRVVEEIIAAEPARSAGQVGLEAGSKPELLAVLALSLAPGASIICNGYKDREYIRMALMGQLLGYRVCIVIEKHSELPIILEEAKALGIKPNIGLRARLSSIGKGKWQNTGGEKSKFGLSTSQILNLLDELRAAGQLDCLNLLHFHLGSQIANIRDLQTGLQECAVIYAQLQKLGAPIATVDIGGGLGVDYDGTQSRNVCSINYSMQDYAGVVVKVFKECCEREQLPAPNLISESGRALTAHHAVLMTDIVASESPRHEAPEQPSSNEPALAHLWADYQALLQAEPQRSLIEIYHDAKHAIDDVNALFVQGHLALTERAQAEQLYSAICTSLLTKLDPQHRDHFDIIDELNEKLAEKLFVNFSLFQSTPDVWGIDQIFPIVPSKGLDQPLTRRGIIQDITCDSDGRIDHYVSSEGLESSLRLPTKATEDKELLCFFLVGAYQEILGDMHNLFGDTDSVDVNITEAGELEFEHAIRGDTVAKVLEYVNLSPQTLLANYRQRLEQQMQGQQALIEQMMLAFEDGLSSYTYLGD